MQIFKIVITGGPCAGKSSAIERVRATLEKKDYTVLAVAETSTELISGGVAPWTCDCQKTYQKCLLQLQLAKEQTFLQAAETMSAERILLIFDRGALDGKAYLKSGEFAEILAELELTESALLARYDGIFHLESVAKCNEQAYTTANNKARTETAKEAAELDRITAKCWQNHPHRITICGAPSFEEKMHLLTCEIEALLAQS